MAKITTLHLLFEEEIADLYSAEQQILKALPKMIKAANSPELSQAFSLHLEQTQQQVDRLEEISQNIEIKLKRTLCVGMEGVIAEGKKHMEVDALPELLDLTLISSAQRVEHYEIAGYRTAVTYAEIMGHAREAKLLQKTLEEEGETDKILTKLAKKLQKQVPMLED